MAFKSGIWFTACNIITKSIGFLTTPIFTRMMTQEEFGDYNNYSTWLGLILYITSLNLESSLIRARFDFEEDLDSYVSSMACLSLISTLFWFFIFVVFFNPLQKVLLFDRTQLYAMFLYLLFYPAIQLYQTRERFEYKYKNTVLITLLVIVSSSVLSVILVTLFENKLFGRIIGTVLPIILIGSAILLIIFRKSRDIKMCYWQYAIPFAIPFIPHLLSMYILGSMDKVMIKQICGSKDLALYSLAYTIGTIMSLLVNSMNSAFSPWLGEQLSRKRYSVIKKISIPYVGFFAFLSVLAVLITPEVLFVLGGSSYSDARYVIPQIFAGCLMQFIYCLYVNVEQYEKKTGGMALASCISAVFNFITNYIFIRKYGYIAASYTTFCRYFLLMLLHMILVKRIGRSFVYDNKAILFIGLAASILLILINRIFNYTIIRLVVFALLSGVSLLIAYKNRFYITKILSKG